MATGCGEGAVRAANAALRACGGFEVWLRLPGMAGSGGDAEQLGLGTPQFQDASLGPAVWRKTGAADVLLLGAGEVARLVSAQEFASAESLFRSAVGVVVSGVLYAVAASEPLLAAGVPWAYRLHLQAPAWA